MSRINLNDRTTWPKIGSTWEHRNGNLYRVLMYTNREGTKEDYPITISYRNVNNNEDYSGRLDDWERRMTWIKDTPHPETLVIRIRNAIDGRINDLLTETKPEHDDSLVGINEAWSIVRKTFKEYLDREPHQQ